MAVFALIGTLWLFALQQDIKHDLKKKAKNML